MANGTIKTSSKSINVTAATGVELRDVTLKVIDGILTGHIGVRTDLSTRQWKTLAHTDITLPVDEQTICINTATIDLVGVLAIQTNGDIKVYPFEGKTGTNVSCYADFSIAVSV